MTNRPTSQIGFHRPAPMTHATGTPVVDNTNIQTAGPRGPALLHPLIRIVGPKEFDAGTAQTTGSVRLAAIAPQLGIQSALWGGLFEVQPKQRTGIHHHGEQQTIAFALSGICEVRW